MECSSIKCFRRLLKNFDEYHEYRDYAAVSVFTGGQGKVRHGRRTFATTDGFFRGGPIDDMKERVRKILDGEVEDGGMLPFICKLDDEAEAKKPALWAKANPSLPYRPELLAQIKREWNEAQDNPSLYSAFMTKRMNIPIADRENIVAEWEKLVAASRPIPDLAGCTCIAGIDYASVSDFVAVGLLFKIGDMRYWITHSFVCLQSPGFMRIKAPIGEWEKQGLLTMIDDVDIAPEYVTNWLSAQAEHYNIKGIAIDNFRYSLMSKALEGIGFKPKGGGRDVFLVKPRDIEKAEPIINSMFLNEQIAWGDNPLMRWYTNNVKKTTSAHGNFSYDKIEPKSRKTDGFMALVAAMTLEQDLVSMRPPTPILDVGVY